jgi:3-hydroxyisobutyrate dehydrogenase-like beta-hydroxyacid dehydrogenase
MGTALARRLLSQGADVTVWNRSQAVVEALVGEGAGAAVTLAGVWDGTDAVFSFLADDAAVRSVLLGTSGLFAVAPKHGLLVEMSTISPGTSAELAAAAQHSGVDYLCCPVSGNPAVLTAGDLTLIVSGEKKAFTAAGDLLHLVGARVLYVGASDEARTMKLAVNAMLAATAEALAEAVLLCEASGIDRATALDVIGSSAVGSPFVAYKRQALIEHLYQATFTMAMLAKDLRLVSQAAAAAHVELPLVRLVGQLVDAANDEGLADLDFLALLVHLQSLAGLPTDVPTANPSC